ncbi:MAG: hypothetical protein KJ749_06405 [Planctomycetes bacterium]|nr:hypothetical protein [Planctomycetota bacterium]
MRRLLDAYKPAGSARTHLLLAALMWTVVGATLITVGGRWLLNFSGPRIWWLAPLAIGACLLKSRFVLDGVAARLINRVRTRGDGRCLGGFLSLRSWALVALMAGGGRILRSGLVSPVILGVAYLFVGVALLLSARRLWRAWHEYHAGTQPD